VHAAARRRGLRFRRITADAGAPEFSVLLFSVARTHSANPPAHTALYMTASTAAAGRDHPRRAGLALHLGAVLDVLTVGVTDDPLLATGDDLGRHGCRRRRSGSGGEVVAYRVWTRKGAKPVIAHAAWRTSAEIAEGTVLGSRALARWPAPMREARRLARELRDVTISPHP